MTTMKQHGEEATLYMQMLYCKSYLISQEAQLGEEVLSQLEFISHSAFLYLCPHGLSLLADGLLKPETFSKTSYIFIE